MRDAAPLPALYVAKRPPFHIRERSPSIGWPYLDPAHHGLASEARSTDPRGTTGRVDSAIAFSVILD